MFKPRETNRGNYMYRKLISLGGMPYTIYDSRIYYATLDALPSEQLWVLTSLLTAKSKINLKNSHLIPNLHGK